MNFSIKDWTEVSEYLGGYVLVSVALKGDILYGINSQGQAKPLAIPSGVFWTASDGKAFEVVEYLLREVKDQVKASGDYSMENKRAILTKEFDKFIHLFQRYQ